MTIKNLLTTILIVSLSILFVSPITAQETVSNQINQLEADYRYQFDQYRTAHRAYQISKAEYITTGTLKAEQEALTDAKIVAIASADVLRTYTSWLRLLLLEHASTYSRVNVITERLNLQIDAYLQHKSQIEASGSVVAFEAVMEEYKLGQDNRDKLFASSQIELKLAQLASFQHQARSLYDPLIDQLAEQAKVPEIEQGMARISQLGDQINQGITNTSQLVGPIESEDFNIRQASRRASENLQLIHSQQLSLLDVMIELENRYGQ